MHPIPLRKPKCTYRVPGEGASFWGWGFGECLDRDAGLPPLTTTSPGEEVMTPWDAFSSWRGSRVPGPWGGRDLSAPLSSGACCQALPHNTDSGRWISPALGLLTREWKAVAKASGSWDRHPGLLGVVSTSHLAVSQSWGQQQPGRGEVLMLERTGGPRLSGNCGESLPERPCHLHPCVWAVVTALPGWRQGED